MKDELKQLIETSLVRLREAGNLEFDALPQVQIERTRDDSHGDFASNIALVMAKHAGCKPRELAQQIVAQLPPAETVTRVEIAGPGFINFFLRKAVLLETVTRILREGEVYGRSLVGAGQRVQVEFVSANPTGPLHIGHGRGAAYGAVVANLLDAAGFDVEREYYVNDAGRQMDILAASVWLRYLEALGEPVVFPANGYRGDYVKDIAAVLRRDAGEGLRRSASEVNRDIPPAQDKEAQIDALIARALELLGAEDYRRVFDLGLNIILDGIREDLAEFGVRFDRWFSERSLTEDGTVDRAIERLRAAGKVYTHEGAEWFRATEYGDEKDRVVVRENGQKTYFASDIAYHMDKYERRFQRMINIWGADHHGYVPRVKAALQAMGEDAGRLEVLLVQFATLYRGAERVQMSSRSGEFVSLRELFEEVGRDAARLFYVMRRCDQHLDFDLELAKSESSDNPVYYIQYAHARVCSVFRQLEEQGLSWDAARGEASLGLLEEAHEQKLMATLGRFPELLEGAALSREPHQLVHYLRELANDFHTYYNAHKFIVDSEALRDARLNLIAATRRVVANGLQLLGVGTPETM